MHTFTSYLTNTHLFYPLSSAITFSHGYYPERDQPSTTTPTGPPKQRPSIDQLDTQQLKTEKPKTVHKMKRLLIREDMVSI